MGPIVRLVGSGMGLASEAIAAHKASRAEKQKSHTQPDSHSPSPGHPAPRSREPSPGPPAASSDNYGSAPPQYSTLDPSSADYGLVETTDEAYARHLIDKGEAIPWDQPHEVEYGDVEDEDDDEAYWELDEAAAREEAPGYEESDSPEYEAKEGGSKAKEEKIDVHKLVKKFLSAHPAPSRAPPLHPLSCHVIIPQRRPHSKSRGFVRAYAPVLNDAGIDQATFMDFLETFQKASQASPFFEVMFLGGHLVGYAPSLTAMAISIPVQVVAGAAIILQSRHRTNTFLDEINHHFFRPRGLFAMLMSYKPSRHNWSSAPTDISQSIAKYADPEGLSHKFTNNMKFSAGKSHGEMELPEAAPLIFPALDAAVDDSNPEHAAKKQNAFKKSGKFVSEYMDRRAQADYNAENPNSSLTVPQEKKFASRYADPTHPAVNGGLIGLVTGGKIDPIARRRARGPIGRLRKATGTNKGLSKIVQANVLYLMIVNMPNEEEMAEARRQMEREKEEKKKKGEDHDE